MKYLLIITLLVISLWGGNKGEDYLKKAFDADIFGRTKEAFKWYEKAANMGNANAQAELGNMYFEGKGVSQNYQKALKWYRKAATKGFSDAQYNLGVMYANGYGVKQNDHIALKWYKKAAKHKRYSATAKNNIGSIYYKKRMYKQAFKWYKQAAKQGYSAAQLILGFMYENGQGVKQDIKEAAKWYKKAAQQGLSNAQYNLGNMYYFGKGVSEDKVKAYEWWKKAAQQGDSGAQNNLDILCSKSPWACKQ